MSKNTFYCWVRVLPAGSEAPRYVDDERGRDDMPADTAMRVMWPSRPPKRSVESQAGKDSDTWVADAQPSGKPKSDLAFDYGPAYRHRQVALSWLLTSAGKDWADAATQYMLMSFEREAS